MTKDDDRQKYAITPSLGIGVGAAETRNYIRKLSKFDPVLAKSQVLVYNFVPNKNKPFQLNSFLDSSFFYIKALISKPIYEITPNNIAIFLFFYSKIALGPSIGSFGTTFGRQPSERTGTAAAHSGRVRAGVDARLAGHKIVGGTERYTGHRISIVAPLQRKVLNSKKVSAATRLPPRKIKIYFNSLTKYLSKLYNTKIQFDLTRLKKTHLNSHI